MGLPGLTPDAQDPASDPAPFRYNEQDYVRQLQDRWSTRLPALSNAGVPLDQIRPLFQYDIRRVQAGREPLSDREFALGLKANLSGEQAIPEPDDSGLSGYLSAPFEDLRNILISLPKMPGAIMEEAQQLPLAGEKLSEALAQPGITEKAQALQQVPGLRMVPGVFTATNLAQGPQGWETIAKHPFSTALDVLPIASEMGLVAKAGEALSPALAKYDRWASEHGLGGSGSRMANKNIVKASRAASLEMDPINKAVDTAAEGADEVARAQASAALQRMVQARGMTIDEDAAARLQNLGIDVQPGSYESTIPEVPTDAQALADMQRRMNPDYEQNLVATDQAKRLEDVPHLGDVLDEVFGKDSGYRTELLTVDDPRLQNLMAYSRQIDNAAGSVSKAESRWQAAKSKLSDYQQDWDKIRSDAEYRGIDTNADEVVGSLREAMYSPEQGPFVGWQAAAGKLLDVETSPYNVVIGETVARKRPDNIAPMRPGEEAFLAGDVTPGRADVTGRVRRLLKRRANPNAAPEEHIIQVERPLGAWPSDWVAGDMNPTYFERYSDKMLRLADEQRAAQQVHDTQRATLDDALDKAGVKEKMAQYRQLLTDADQLESLDGTLKREYRARKSRSEGTPGRMSDLGDDFLPRNAEEFAAFEDQLRAEIAELAEYQRTGVKGQRLQQVDVSTLRDTIKRGIAQRDQIYKLFEENQAKAATLREQAAKFEASPLYQRATEAERIFNEKYRKPLDEAASAYEAEKARVNDTRRKPDYEEVEDVLPDPREQKLLEIYRQLDAVHTGKSPLDPNTVKLLEDAARDLEAQGVVVPPSDVKIRWNERSTRFKVGGPSEPRIKLYHQLFGDQRGTPGVLEEAALALRAEDFALARRKMAAAKRLAEKGVDIWPEFQPIGTEIASMMDHYRDVTGRAGFRKYLKQSEHHFTRIANQADRVKVYEGELLARQEAVAKAKARMANTVRQAPPGRFAPLLTDIMNVARVGRAGAAEALATLKAKMPESLIDIADTILDAEKAGGTLPQGFGSNLPPEQAAMVQEYVRYSKAVGQPFRAADLRKIIRDQYGIEHPAVSALAQGDDAALNAAAEYRDMTSGRVPDALKGRKNTQARMAWKQDLARNLEQTFGADAASVKDFFDHGYDLPPGDYILPSDEGVIKTIQAGGFDKNLDSHVENMLKVQIERTWTQMRDVYGFDPVFVHHARPGAVPRMNLANVTPDRISKPTQAKGRSILGAPYDSDLAVALKHQGYEWINREWTLNSLFGHYDAKTGMWTPGILNSPAEGGFGFTFSQMVEHHIPEINAKANRSGIPTPPPGVDDLNAWINSADADAYRAVASEYLKKRYQRLNPFELLNFKSGGIASRKVGDVREVTRFGPDGPWTMKVPEEVYVPRSISKVMDALTSEKAGPSFLYSIYDKSLDLFRISALAFSPRFHFYNIVGGGLLAFLRTGPGLLDHFAEAARMAGKIKDLAPDMPNELSRGGLYAPEETTRLSAGINEAPLGLGKLGRADDVIGQKLGLAQGGVLGRLWKAARGGAEWSFALNEWVDNLYRSAVYLYGKEKHLRELGVTAKELDDIIARYGTDEVLDVTRNWSKETLSETAPELADALVKKDQVARAGMALSNKVLQDWDSMLPWERHVLRNVIPFYGWVRHITRYVLTYPIDHPWRAAFLTTYSRIENTDRHDPLGDRFQSIFWLGQPGDDGRQLTINTAGLNPFQSVGDMTTFAGFMSQLSPAFQLVLEQAGVDMTTASSSLYPELTYDPESGRLVAVRKSPVESLLGAFIPQTEGLLGATSLSKSMRELAASDPEAWRSRIAVSLGVPLSPRRRSREEEVTKAEVARDKAASTAVMRAMRTGEWAEADRYERAVITDPKTDKPVVVDVQGLKRALAQAQAQAQQEPAGSLPAPG